MPMAWRKYNTHQIDGAYMQVESKAMITESIIRPPTQGKFPYLENSWYEIGVDIHSSMHTVFNEYA